MAEIDIDAFWLRCVTPVVIAHGPQSTVTRSSAAGVGAAERGVEGDEDEIAGERVLRKPKSVIGIKNQPAREQDVDEMRRDSAIHPSFSWFTYP